MCADFLSKPLYGESLIECLAMACIGGDTRLPIELSAHGTTYTASCDERAAPVLVHHGVVSCYMY